MIIHAVSISLKWRILIFSRLILKQQHQPLNCIQNHKIMINQKYKLHFSVRIVQKLYIYSSVTVFNKKHICTEPPFKANLLLGEPPIRGLLEEVEEVSPLALQECSPVPCGAEGACIERARATQRALRVLVL